MRQKIEKNQMTERENYYLCNTLKPLTTREYTLLIVESSVVANQLRDLQIPWLEVSTN
jgi:hypothetical protein